MIRYVKILILITLLFLLIGVRAFLEPCFYDPLIEYFKENSLIKPLPELNFPIYFANIFYRYFINSSISIFIIYLIFNEKKTLNFVLKFYIISFIILVGLLFSALNIESLNNNLLIFYVRRFLIQPLFLFILLPAIYYQNLKLKNKAK